VDRAGHQPGRHEYEHEAGDAEEARQVELDAAAVDEQPDGDRRGEAEHRARAGARGIVGVLEHREQEHHGLEPFAEDGEERHRHQRAGRAGRQRRAGAAAQLAGEVARVAAHPHHHERDDPHRRDADHGLEPLLPALRELLVEQLERDPGGDADRHRGADAQPHRAQRVAPALLAQEAGDEGGFDALAQADDKNRQHPCEDLALGFPNGTLGHPKMRMRRG
jgi:hypothetical protein